MTQSPNVFLRELTATEPERLIELRVRECLLLEVGLRDVLELLDILGLLVDAFLDILDLQAVEANEPPL